MHTRSTGCVPSFPTHDKQGKLLGSVEAVPYPEEKQNTAPKKPTSTKKKSGCHGECQIQSFLEFYSCFEQEFPMIFS